MIYFWDPETIKIVKKSLQKKRHFSTSLWDRFWNDFGVVLGGFWGLSRALRLFLGVIFSCLYLGWSSKGLLEASGLDLGSILEGLEGILGGFGEGFGRDLLAAAGY